jgi:chemotaxis protein histidine kinase CheA
MLSPEQRLFMFRQALPSNLKRMRSCLESVDAEIDVRSNLAGLLRAVHSIKTDAQAAGLTALARLVDHVERVVEASAEHTDYALERDVVGRLGEHLEEIERAPEGRSLPEADAELRAQAQRAGDAARQRMKGMGPKRA